MYFIQYEKIGIIVFEVLNISIGRLRNAVAAIRNTKDCPISESHVAL